MKSKKLLLAVGLLAVIVWGNLVLTIKKATTDSDAVVFVNKTDRKQRKRLKNNQRVHFKGKFRDPFYKIVTENKTIHKEKKEIFVKKQEKAIYKSNLKLSGIIGNSAILIKENQESVFSVIGDIIEGAEVTYIGKDKVVMKFKGDSDTLKIDKKIWSIK